MYHPFFFPDRVWSTKVNLWSMYFFYEGPRFFLCFCLLYHIASRVIELCTGDICFIDSTSQPDSCFIYTVLLLSEGKIFRPILPHRDMVWTWGLEGQWNTEWPRILSGLYRVLYILVSIHKPTNQKLLLLSLGLVIVRPLFVIRAREYPRWPAPPFHLARAYKVDSTKEMSYFYSFSGGSFRKYNLKK